MISLNVRSVRPIYEQVRDGMRHLVICGAIQAGEELPSVRALASALAINPNTIQRAYEALEAEGYLCTVQGKGSFAAPGSQVKEARREQLLRQLDESATELVFLGFRLEELCERLKRACAAGAGAEKEGLL